MTPGARIQAAIDCLEPILLGAPVEKTLTNWARKSRFAGSKDRAAVRDHVFDALRSRDSFAFLGGADLPVVAAQPGVARQIMIGMCVSRGDDVICLFDGKGHSPASLDDRERATVEVRMADVRQGAIQPGIWNMAEWCADLLKSQYGAHAFELAGLLRERAPVDLRVNVAKATRTDARQTLLEDGIDAAFCEVASTALRVTSGARRIRTSRAYERGLVELQDAGSQALIDALSHSSCLRAGARVLDYCAGGGGKTIAMAARQPATYHAHDSNPSRMADIPLRAKRAGASVSCISTQDLQQKAPYDLVLCDVPCSGSGAWRRNPGTKWTLTKDDLMRLCAVQSDVLVKASPFVAQGGYLAYATCSLFAEENEDQVKCFLNNRDEFKKILEKSWSPAGGSDGFYLAILEKVTSKTA